MARRLVAPMAQADKDAAAKAAARWASLAPPKIDWKSGGEGAEVSYSLWGFESLVDTLKLMPDVAQDAAGYEMELIAAEVIATARDGMVPYRSGRLSSSGDWDRYDNVRKTSIAEIKMWFGAPPTGESAGTETFTEVEALQGGAHKVEVDPSEYALIQHEDLTFNHPQGGGPKYLEIPFLAAVPTVLTRITDAIGGAMELNPRFIEFAISPDSEG